MKWFKVMAGICVGVFLFAGRPLLSQGAEEQASEHLEQGQPKDKLEQDQAKEKEKEQAKAKAKETWQVGVSGTYTSGKYGTDVRTDTVYVPLTIRRLFESGDLTVVVPYVRITSNGAVTFVNGVPTRIQ